MALPSSVEDFVEGSPRMPSGSALQGLKDSVLSVSGSLTGDTGSIQAGATKLNNAKNLIGTVGTAGDSFVLPYATVGGAEVWVYNSSATSADIFPAPGDYIAAGAVNIAQAVAGGATVVFACMRTRTPLLGGLWAVNVSA